MSLEEVLAGMRESGDIHVGLYETVDDFRLCVGNPFRWRDQRLKRFTYDRKPDAAAWLHRKILQLYPSSRYASAVATAAE